MKLIATRQATVNEIVPDEGVTHEGKRYIVDEVHRNRDGWSLSCNSEENPSVTRRRTINFKDGETVTIEAGEADRRELIGLLQGLLAGDGIPGDAFVERGSEAKEFFDYDAKGGSLTINLNARDRAWTILIEA